jgi:hypothetical protein
MAVSYRLRRASRQGSCSSRSWRLRRLALLKVRLRERTRRCHGAPMSIQRAILCRLAVGGGRCGCRVRRLRPVYIRVRRAGCPNRGGLGNVRRLPIRGSGRRACHTDRSSWWRVAVSMVRASRWVLMSLYRTCRALLRWEWVAACTAEGSRRGLPVWRGCRPGNETRRSEVGR